MARFNGRMRRVVRSPADRRDVADAFAHARLGRSVLFPRHDFQLSAFHGDDLSRLSHAPKFREIQNRDVARHAAGGAHGHHAARFLPIAALGVHSLHLLEPVALLRAKLRVADDVRAAQRRHNRAGRAPLDTRSLRSFVPDAFGQLRDRRFHRSADSVARVCPRNSLCRPA